MSDPRNYENYDVTTNRLVIPAAEFGAGGFYDQDPLREDITGPSFIDTSLKTIADSKITQSISNKVSSFGSSLKSFWSKMPTAIRGETPGGEEFITKFYGKIKTKDRTGVVFQKGLFMEIFTQWWKEHSVMLLYFHNHLTKDCRYVDSLLMTDPKIQKETSEGVLCYGLNVNTKHGQLIMQNIKPESLPHISIIIPDESKNVLILWSLEGTDPITERLITELQKAKATIKNIKEKVEAKKKEEEEFKLIKVIKFYSKYHLFRKWTNKLQRCCQKLILSVKNSIEDKILRDSQKKELEEAMEKDRILMEQKFLSEANKMINENKKQEAEELKSSLISEREEKRAILLSLMTEEPKEGPDVYTLQFRLPNGKSKTRNFLSSSKISDIYDYIWIIEHEIGLESELNEYTIMQNIPVKHFTDKALTLKEAGIEKRAVLIVKEHHSDENESDDDEPDLLEL